MKNYIICFYQNGQASVDKNGKETEFVNGGLIKVTEEEMFRWIERAKFDTIKLVIYDAEIICDLS